MGDLNKQIEDLQAMLAARKGLPGYRENCVAIEAEIARLETLTSAAVETPPQP